MQDLTTKRLFYFFHCAILLGQIVFSQQKNTEIQHAMFYAPVSPVIQWTPVKPETFDCDKTTILNIPDEDTPDTVKIHVHAPSQILSLVKRGYLCTRSTWVTECQKDFLGSEIVIHKIIPGVPTHEGCIEAISTWETNHLTNLGFPPKSCSWMKTSITSNEAYRVQKESVQFDAYKNQYLHAIFFQRTCSSSPCLTIYPDTLWLSDLHDLSNCFSVDREQVIISNFNSSDISKIRLFSTSYKAHRIQGSCRATFCGYDGLSLPTGEWMGIMEADIQLLPWYQDIELCPKDHDLKQETSSAKLLSSSLFLLEMQLKKTCHSIKDKLIFNKSISRSDLSALNPRMPGVNYVYRLNNEKLEVGLSSYKLLSSCTQQCTDITTSAIGIDLFREQPVMWNYWVRNKLNKDITEGPNGIYYYKSQLINPGLLDGSVSFTLESMTEELTVSVDHPVLRSDDHITMLTQEFQESSDDQSILETISNAWEWSTMGIKNIFYYAFITVCLSLATIILVKVLSLIKTKVAKGKQLKLDESEAISLERIL